MIKLLLLASLLVGCDDRTVRVDGANGLAVYVQSRTTLSPKDACEVSVRIDGRTYIPMFIPTLVPYPVKPTLAEKPAP